jgi:ADP-ribose pyrophosphatase YjhB (NUDIX family)
MQRRPSARLLILDGENRVLLFRFSFTDGPLAGVTYWATPGGGLEGSESYEAAAIREMQEETGLSVGSIGQHVAERECVVPMPDGESVISVERYFVIKVADASLSRDGWTEQELKVMTDHRWWSMDELGQTLEQVWPRQVPAIVAHSFHAPALPPLKFTD